LHAEILSDNPLALWKREQLDALRVSALPEVARIVVGVDPPAGGRDEETAAECGIIVAALGASDGHGYVLDDCSLRGSPGEWGAAVVAAYHKWRANLVVGEINQGGDMVKFVVSQAAIASGDYALPFKAVRATRGKALRAEPVAAIYEQGRAHHVGHYGLLEDQQCEWQPAFAGAHQPASGQKSPDRLDALVWALTELMLPDGEDETPAAGPPIILSGRRS
jgi:phage terminase large subunit-like protein